MKAFDVVYYNGSFIDKSDLILASDNRALQYGDGLFETMHSNAKEVQFFEHHMERLHHGLSILKIPLDTKYHIIYLKEVLEGLLHRNRLYQGASIKLSVWRSADGKYITKNCNANILIEASYLSEGPYQFNKLGLNIGVRHYITKPIHPIFSFKSKNSLVYILAGLEVSENAWSDGLLVNDKGFLVEATSSNLFLISGKSVITPSLSTGCVNGVMRRNVMQIAQSVGYDMVEKEDLRSEDILTVDEVFITNAVKGIQWVGGYENKRFLNKQSKKFLVHLNQMAGF